MSLDVVEVTRWAMVELIRESGYLSLEHQFEAFTFCCE